MIIAQGPLIERTASCRAEKFVYVQLRFLPVPYMEISMFRSFSYDCLTMFESCKDPAFEAIFLSLYYCSTTNAKIQQSGIQWSILFYSVLINL